MLARMFSHLGDAITEKPLISASLVFFDACKIATDIISPLMFVAGIEELMEGEKETALAYFTAGYAGLTFASQFIIRLQEKLLIPRGTALGAKITYEAGEASFNRPKDVVDPNLGESYPFVNKFGGSAQPGGVAHSLLPVTNDILTCFVEMSAINAFMWWKLGEVTWLSTLQTFISLASTGPLAKKIGEGVIDFIDHLYKGFSHAIVFANGYETNILLNQQEIALKKFHKYLLNELNPSTERYLNINSNALIVPDLLGNIFLIASFVYAIKKDLLTSNEFILLVFYNQLLTRLSERLTQRLIEGISSYGLFVDILKYIAEGSLPNAKKFNVESSNADIKVEKISYTYPKSDKPIFKGISIDIKPGKVIALTGDNGTGKSTFLNMLYGFTKPEKGHIYLAGQDIAELNPNSMRAHYAIIPQKPAILVGSFRRNIRCGFPNATKEDVLAVMKEVGLYPKFSPSMKIKFSYEGPQLSGGEKQRLVIARALLAIRLGGNIQYLFCDEGVVSIDSEGKGILLNNLKSIIEKYKLTTIIITHNLKEMQKFISFDEVIDLSKLNKHKHSAKASNNSASFFHKKSDKDDSSDSDQENQYVFSNEQTSPGRFG